MKKRVALVVALLALAFWQVSAISTGLSARAAEDDTAGFAYKGDIEHGGTISVTLTRDQSGVRRLEFHDFLGFVRETKDGFEPVYFGMERYYAPPLPLVDGSAALTFAVPSQTIRFQPQLRVDLQVDSNTQVSGAVQFCLLYSCPAPPSSAPRFTAFGPQQFPPQIPATIHGARIEGQQGIISFAFDANGAMLFFTLHNIVAPPCFTQPASLTVVLSDATPEEFGAAVNVVGMGQLTLVGRKTGDAYSGSLAVSTSGCSTELHWTTGFPAVTATPPPIIATSTSLPMVTATPASPALPATGSGPAGNIAPWWPALVALVAASIGTLGLAHARRAS